MSTKYQIIVDIWERMEREVVGAPELELIQQAIAVRFGTILSLATIARTLADHGARLGHPEVIAADANWRQRTSLFTSEDLTLDRLEAANAFIEKIELLREQFEKDKPKLEHLRQSFRKKVCRTLCETTSCSDARKANPRRISNGARKLIVKRSLSM